jgi:hypothetical protein
MNARMQPTVTRAACRSSARRNPISSAQRFGQGFAVSPVTGMKAF